MKEAFCPNCGRRFTCCKVKRFRGGCSICLGKRENGLLAKIEEIEKFEKEFQKELKDDDQ